MKTPLSVPVPVRLTVGILLTIGLAVLIFIFIQRRNHAASSYRVDPARITSLRQMADLCALELREEMMLRDSVNGKWIVARERIEGRVTFDLEKIHLERHNDTLTLWLPKETVEIRENAGPDAYEVLDAWDSRRPVLPRVLTTAEENTLKERWGRAVRQRLERDGQIARARRNALTTIGRLTSTWPEVADSQLTVMVRGEWE